ncbi:MAG: putative lipopolysaccharide heptosyltransferase III [Chlamydiae bacterium RIFCSPHIGHO2_12_FULL_49_11]|nr:MAG: putative lipopolysaccharide heptosyltransferase III [Chlamydiae bacterium RIFCSPHIGHO2_12_FULL_49_11]
MDHKNFIEMHKVRKVLFCIFKYHGDVLLTSPLYQILKNHYPHIAIHVFLFKDTLPMLEGHPAIDFFHTFDHEVRQRSRLNKLGYELKQLWAIRGQRYDVVFNLTSGDRGAIAAKVSGAPVRVGIESDGGMRGKDRFFTHLVWRARTPRHVVETNLDLLRVIGLRPAPDERNLIFSVPDERNRIFTASCAEETAPFALVHPYTRTSMKLWHIEGFRTVIGHLLTLGLKVVVSGGGGEEEKEYIDTLCEGFSPERVESRAGKTSLKELGGLVRKAEIIVTVDTVTLHLASAFKKRCVAIFGPSDEVKWGPWQNPEARIVRLHRPCARCDQEGCGGSWVSDCLDNLPAEHVIKAIDTLNFFRNSAGAKI